MASGNHVESEEAIPEREVLIVEKNISSSSLLKTRKVLQRSERQYSVDHIFFQQENEDGIRPRYTTGIYLSNADVEDMGNPDVITVTVEPGDLLNPPGEFLG